MYLNPLNSSQTITVNNICFLESNKKLKITLNSILLNSITYQILLNSVVLSRTKAKPGDITIQTFEFDELSNNYYAISSDVYTTVANTDENVVKTVSLTINTAPSKLNELQAFSLYL
jgi:hypothetical protein